MKDKSQENSAVTSAAKPNGGPIGSVVIDVRFHPNGLVNMINHRPANMEPQDWFDYLCKEAVPYRPLSGGRGSFTLPAETYESLCALQQAAE